MSDEPYPEITSAEDLSDRRPVTYLETVGRLRSIRLTEDDDPVEVARQLGVRSGETRFRVVTIQRFSLKPELPEPFLGPPCTATDTLEDGAVVRCEHEAHSDGVDHAGRILRDGRAGPVHYWRSKPAHTP
ncbi:hypothetical protein ACGFZB_28950 [Streptomyces cinerochromogenes]|uniref:UbiC transcription regulator-associated domain-containing protein n=1 Tax=Streptomyces cinerochromogenes TaxID=66422 RepID=A0ABW7BEB1_9ACTN